jgi:hypothetical protein
MDGVAGLDGQTLAKSPIVASNNTRIRQARFPDDTDMAKLAMREAFEVEETAYAKQAELEEEFGVWQWFRAKAHRRCVA